MINLGILIIPLNSAFSCAFAEMLPCTQVHYEKQICCMLHNGKQKGNVYGNGAILIRRSGNGSQVYDLQVQLRKECFIYMKVFKIIYMPVIWTNSLVFLSERLNSTLLHS